MRYCSSGSCLIASKLRTDSSISRLQHFSAPHPTLPIIIPFVAYSTFLLLANARYVDYDFTKFTIQPTPLFAVFVVAKGGEMLRIKPILLHARLLNGIGCTLNGWLKIRSAASNSTTVHFPTVLLFGVD